jgi:pimeloyl-ACP methyl ester carboxylesterase
VRRKRSCVVRRGADGKVPRAQCGKLAGGLPNPMETAQPQTMRVADNRVLDTLVTGPVKGQALVFHHGTPGAYPQLRVLTEQAHRLNLRIITYSRPGHGDSTRLAGRRVVDVATDTAALLDALGFERCLIAGWSGGGPHALACAARLPDRVAAALDWIATGAVQLRIWRTYALAEAAQAHRGLHSRATMGKLLLLPG